MIVSLIIAPVIIIPIISFVVSSEAGQNLAGTVVIRKVTIASSILIVVSMAIILG
jgi:hypothetical protein